ncbi:MAG: DUF1444 family protein [Phycisphaerales bacterium]|nr:DUF1444 family protein [Phycisphaerales bacterium]
MTPAAFTQEVASQLRRAQPELTVEVKGELSLLATFRGGRELSLQLDNLYRDAVRDWSAKDAVIDRFVKQMLLSASEINQDLRSNLVCVVKDRPWLDSLPRRPGQAVADVAFRDLNGELVVVYGVDRDSSVSYPSWAEITAAGISRDEVDRLAIENLRQRLGPITVRGGDGLMMVTAGGVYESSLLLLEDFWDAGRLGIKGEIVVAVPSRDILVIADGARPDSVRRLREIAENTVGSGSYPLVPTAFVRRDGKFIRLD